MGVAAVAAPLWQEDAALRDSLSRVHPRFRASWLRERGIRDEYWQGCVSPVDSGLRCVGRWSYGPSYDVDGRVTPNETLVALARGSGVSLIRFARTDSIELELLADVNAGGLMKRVAVRDSLLYVGSTAGLEIWSITDERNPRQLSWLHTALNDFDVQDSFAYVIGPDDSFKVYNVSNAASPVLRGACRDSGHTVAVTGDLALVGDRWGLYLLDVSDPVSPRHVNSWGSAIDAVAVRGGLACVTTFNPNQPGELRLNTLDVSDPQSIGALGALNGAGGLDVHLQDTLVFCSGDGDDHSLKIASIADSTRPRLISASTSPGWGRGIWASGANKTAFYASHFEGMQVFNVADLVNPVRDTGGFAADAAKDIDIRNGLAAVACNQAGFALLDVTNPAAPFRLGVYDTAGQRPFMSTSALDDSFAFVGWHVPTFFSIDITYPTHPEFAGSCLPVANRAEDMALRDTFVYVIEDGALRVVNVASPREPVLVGSCVVYAYVSDLELRDTLAYVAGEPFSIVNLARPSAPFVVRQWNSALGVAVSDTIAYLGTPYWLKSISVARPASPYVLDSAYVNDYLQDVAVVDTLVVGGGDMFHVFSTADPRNLRLVATSSAPAYVQRLFVQPPFIWAACDVAGICAMETVATGLAEACRTPRPTTGVRVWPTVAARAFQVEASGQCVRAPQVFGVSGAVVAAPTRVTVGGERSWRVDMSQVPNGVYAIGVMIDGKLQTQKVVKTVGR